MLSEGEPGVDDLFSLKDGKEMPIQPGTNILKLEASD